MLLVESWCGLRDCANGVIGNTEYHLDRRVHCAEPEGPDRELHQRVLSADGVEWRSRFESALYSCEIPKHDAQASILISR